jgi:RimJ/RimL family protein N-acetyltransferase
LDQEELAFCRAQGIELSYDCAQIGWVTASCSDAQPSLPSADGAAVVAESSTPEAGAERLVHALSSQIAELPTNPVDRAAVDRLRSSVASRISACRDLHGVLAANRWHLAAEARLAQVESGTDHSMWLDDEFSFRAWTPADAPVYREMLDNPRLWQYLPETQPQPLTEEMALTLIEVGRVDARQHVVAIVRDGEPVGQCLLRRHESFAGVRSGEVAYWLAEEHWSKGWMSRILPAFVAYCFANLEVDVLEAWIHEEHKASAKVAERSGFERDGFAFEAELATALAKPRAQRYLAHRPAPSGWQSADHEARPSGERAAYATQEFAPDFTASSDRLRFTA